MMILNVNKLSKSYGFGDVLKDVSFSVNEGEKVAIVGENGAGKSTLLKIIFGIEGYRSGSISLKKGACVEYLEQGDNADVKQGKCIDILKTAFEHIFKTEQQLKMYEQQMAEETDDVKLNFIINAYCSLQEEFNRMGGYDWQTQINYVVNGLKIDKNLLEREFDTLSGGERTLVNFAKILLSKPDLLLLDEPTNHLDIDRMEWLEGYVKNYSGTVLIVSHDRYFLDKVVDKIIEIDNATAKIYFGNYSSYLQQKEADEVKEFQQYKIQQRKFAEMEKAIKRLKEWGRQADNPMFFRRAKAIQSNLDRLKAEAIEKPKEKKDLPINFDASRRSSQEILRLNQFNLKVCEKELLVNSNAVICNADKVAIVGKNGCGKSTLIKTILGEHDEYQGGMTVGNCLVGYLSQIIQFEDNKQTLLWTFMNELGMDEQNARSVLYNFQFYKNDWTKKVGGLSGGEKLRLKLAILLQSKVNLLIFDEPTNHIDIATREVLEDSLSNFKGTIIFVSHDRYFINKLATKIIAFEDKHLTTYEGDYNYYMQNRNK